MVVPPKHPKMIMFTVVGKHMVVGYHHFRKPPFSLHEKVSRFQTLPLEQTCVAFLASLCETFGFHRPAKIILKTPFQQNLNLNSPRTSSKLKTRCIYRCMSLLHSPTFVFAQIHACFGAKETFSICFQWWMMLLWRWRNILRIAAAVTARSVYLHLRVDRVP